MGSWGADAKVLGARLSRICTCEPPICFLTICKLAPGPPCCGSCLRDKASSANPCFGSPHLTSPHSWPSSWSFITLCHTESGYWVHCKLSATSPLLSPSKGHFQGHLHVEVSRRISLNDNLIFRVLGSLTDSCVSLTSHEELISRVCWLHFNICPESAPFLLAALRLAWPMPPPPLA